MFSKQLLMAIQWWRSAAFERAHSQECLHSAGQLYPCPGEGFKHLSIRPWAAWLLYSQRVINHINLLLLTHKWPASINLNQVQWWKVTKYYFELLSLKCVLFWICFALLHFRACICTFFSITFVNWIKSKTILKCGLDTPIFTMLSLWWTVGESKSAVKVFWSETWQ